MIHDLGGLEHFRFGFIGERAVFESDNRLYYERRWAQASQLGDRAADPKIAAIHYELALRYAILSIRANEARHNVVAIRKERAADSPEPARAMFHDRIEPAHKQALEHA